MAYENEDGDHGGDTQEDPMFRPPPIMSWEDIEAGKPGQLYLPGCTPAPTLAERALLVLARKWYKDVQAVDAGTPLPASADDLTLSCLLLAVAWGREFTGVARQQAEANREAAARARLMWFDQLPWELVESAHPATTSRRSHHVENLTVNFEHHKSSIRVWMMHIAWIVRSWLSPSEALPRLLKNVADTLLGAYMAAGLAAALVSTKDEFWALARGFDPPSMFADQYRERLDHVEQLGVLEIQAPFWKLEARCWKAIADAVLGLRF